MWLHNVSHTQRHENIYTNHVADGVALFSAAFCFSISCLGKYHQLFSFFISQGEHLTEEINRLGKLAVTFSDSC